MELTWVGYSRKNLLFPNAQLWPHSNFGDEIKYIQSHAKLQDRLQGTGHILGPITGDHWFVYVADHPRARATRKNFYHRPRSPRLLPDTIDEEPSTERTINLMMFDMDPEVSELFFKRTCETGKEMTAKTGIATLCPGATIDETAFTPCGYSMNAILHDAYFTIHVTPEKECSYASFETNTSLRNYSSMVRNVLTVFRPKRFVLTMFGDEAAVESIPELPTDPKLIPVSGLGLYVRTSLASTKVETDLCCLMGCYSLDDTKRSINPIDFAPAIDCSLNNANRRSAMDALGALKARERGYSLC
jgi:S-adenosylmethionine decarboxylase